MLDEEFYSDLRTFARGEENLENPNFRKKADSAAAEFFIELDLFLAGVGSLQHGLKHNLFEKNSENKVIANDSLISPSPQIFTHYNPLHHHRREQSAK